MNNLNLYIKTALILLLLSPLTPEAQVISEKGIGSMELQRLTCRNNRPSDQKVHLAAIEKAKLSAWSKYTASFNAEKTASYLEKENEFTGNLENYITDYVVLDSDCSKSRRVYTISLRVSINATKVDSILVTGAGGSELRAELKGQGIMYLVVPRETDDADIFDARRNTQTQTKRSLSADEMISESEGSISITEASTQREAVTTGGKTTQQRTDRTYVIGDLTDAESQIGNVLTTLGMRGMSASRLENMAVNRMGYSPFIKDVLDQFSGKIGDYGANISPQTREEIINMISDVGQGRIAYFMLGTMDTSTPRTDPDTGAKKMDVLVNVQLYKIDDFFGAEVVATVGPEIKSAFGETDVIAKTEALKKAFSEATNTLIFKL
tara:strand:+ start:930 stop:2069 length:1140 start_codon:yes stop_codon:yes gene_type:complete